MVLPTGGGAASPQTSDTSAAASPQTSTSAAVSQLALKAFQTQIAGPAARPETPPAQIMGAAGAAARTPQNQGIRSPDARACWAPSREPRTYEEVEIKGKELLTRQVESLQSIVDSIRRLVLQMIPKKGEFFNILREYLYDETMEAASEMPRLHIRLQLNGGPSIGQILPWLQMDEAVRIANIMGALKIPDEVKAAFQVHQKIVEVRQLLKQWQESLNTGFGARAARELGVTLGREGLPFRSTPSLAKSALQAPQAPQKEEDPVSLQAFSLPGYLKAELSKVVQREEQLLVLLEILIQTIGESNQGGIENDLIIKKEILHRVIDKQKAASLSGSINFKELSKASLAISTLVFQQNLQNHRP